MIWKFDQVQNVTCITCRAVVAGDPVLVVTHYEDDHSWAFLDGRAYDPSTALVVAMSTVVNAHPELDEIASLPPGWTATRAAVGQPWIKQQDAWEADEE